MVCTGVLCADARQALAVSTRRRCGPVCRVLAVGMRLSVQSVMSFGCATVGTKRLRVVLGWPWAAFGPLLGGLAGTTVKCEFDRLRDMGFF